MQDISEQKYINNNKVPFYSNKFLILLLVLVFIISLSYVGYSIVKTFKSENTNSDSVFRIGESKEDEQSEETNLDDVDNEINNLEQKLQEINNN